MRPHLSGLNRNIVFATLLCVLPLAAINCFSPEYLNAETLMFSVMSIQNVTPFVWGQDRLANFVSYPLSPISSPHLNLFAHLWLFSLSFFLLLLACARLVVRLMQPAGESDADFLVVFVIAVVVSLLTLSPFASHVFILEGQPYAASYLLLFVAFFSFLRVSERAALHGTIFALALFVAIGLNFSILVPAGALACGYALIEKIWRGDQSLWQSRCLWSPSGWQSQSGTVTHRGAVRVLCLTAPFSQCVSDIDQYTQRHWKVVEEKCPGKCSLLVLTPHPA